MNTSSEEQSGFAVKRVHSWPIGGAIAGAIGAFVFGILLWAIDPEIVTAAVPALYGFEQQGVAGWTIHVAHGAILGVLFGFIVTRDPVVGVLLAPVETDLLARTTSSQRLVGAGFVFGLAIWSILPVLALPVWLETIGTEQASAFPGTAVESLAGHLLFGIVLGIVFAVLVSIDGRRTSDPLG